METIGATGLIDCNACIRGRRNPCVSATCMGAPIARTRGYPGLAAMAAGLWHLNAWSRNGLQVSLRAFAPEPAALVQDWFTQAPKIPTGRASCWEKEGPDVD